MAKDPYRYFRIEARELMDQLGSGVLDLEKGSTGGELVPRLLRLAHTLKGAARVVKQAEIADLIHGVEGMLEPHRDAATQAPPEKVDRILLALDAINTRLTQLAAAPDGAPASPSPALPAPLEPVDEPVRLAKGDMAEIDMLLEGLDEIGGELAGMRTTLAALKDIRERSDLQACIERIDRELRQARDTAQRLRLVPVAGIFHALERTARDAAHSMGKQIVFEASGGEVRVDAAVLGSVQGALVQLVRNAVAHGIESASQRQAAGKPPAGRITLEVTGHGYRAWFRCSDDGRGVDLEAVRQALLAKGAPATDTHGMGAAQLLALLLQGGITTASSVTELAGRGVGLDVVRAAAAHLNGEVVADTAAGRGTTIELRVPLSLAALNVLMVEADGQLAAIPLDAVQRTLRVAVADIVHTPQTSAIADQGALIPLVVLALGSTNNRLATQHVTAVVVSAAGKTLALAVTRLCGIDTVVVRPLPPLAPALPIVLGMHLDAQGNPRMVLDPAQFATLACQTCDTAAHAAARRVPILIIDDSLTTRMLESSILESAGFAVEMATCAEEGLAMAQKKKYALFLVDVEMPGMDGFGFVEQTRADPALREVPCILVTSRDAPEDRRRGAAVGASAYIVKGEFDQVEFLQRVAQLVAP